MSGKIHEEEEEDEFVEMNEINMMYMGRDETFKQ
jgi:hypothetical protein